MMMMMMINWRFQFFPVNIIFDEIPVSFHRFSGPMGGSEGATFGARWTPAAPLCRDDVVGSATFSFMHLALSSRARWQKQGMTVRYGWGCRVFRLISVYFFYCILLQQKISWCKIFLLGKFLGSEVWDASRLTWPKVWWRWRWRWRWRWWWWWWWWWNCELSFWPAS